MGERDAATAQARQAQLQLLQAQIQPHFIFNTLAALQHWVDRSDPRAAPLLRQVSAFLRAATDMLGKDSVSLTEELTQVEHYLGIMKARWGERLRFELGCDPTLRDQSLPPGLLLTLVENAVEHGLSHQLDGGQVWVEAGLNAAGQIQIQVRDDGAGLAPQWQAGVGLSNVRERLQHHFGPGADLTLQPPRRRRLCRHPEHSPMNPITLLIADDEEAPREQLAQALAEAWPEARIVAQCRHGADAWDQWLEHEPAVCFLDIRMPGLRRHRGGTAHCRPQRGGLRDGVWRPRAGRL